MQNIVFWPRFKTYPCARPRISRTRFPLKGFDPDDHLGKDFGGECLLDFLIFREITGDAVLEKVIQALLRPHKVLASGREAGLQRFHIPVTLDLCVFCSVQRHDRTGYAGESFGQIQT